MLTSEFLNRSTSKSRPSKVFDYINEYADELDELASDVGMKNVEERRLKRAISDVLEKNKSFD